MRPNSLVGDQLYQMQGQDFTMQVGGRDYELESATQNLVARRARAAASWLDGDAENGVA